LPVDNQTPRHEKDEFQEKDPIPDELRNKIGDDVKEKIHDNYQITILNKKYIYAFLISKILANAVIFRYLIINYYIPLMYDI